MTDAEPEPMPTPGDLDAVAGVMAEMRDATRALAAAEGNNEVAGALADLSAAGDVMVRRCDRLARLLRARAETP
jgi:hypothetical protein